MKAVQIDGLEFESVGPIIPESDRHGNIVEYNRHAEYENKKNLPLDRHGRGPFCKFTLDKRYAQKSGVYAMISDEDILYIGKCVDLQNRFNVGYGNISPRNCFKGGQPTNCRINSNILKRIKRQKEIRLYFLETKCISEIEQRLIAKTRPPWNKTRA